MDKNAVLEIIFGRWRCQIAYSGVKLGIFDALGHEGKYAAPRITALAIRCYPVTSISASADLAPFSYSVGPTQGHILIVTVLLWPYPPMQQPVVDALALY